MTTLHRFGLSLSLRLVSSHLASPSLYIPISTFTMFSSFNFKEAPKNKETARRGGRKDRSIRYLRALNAKNNRTFSPSDDTDDTQVSPEETLSVEPTDVQSSSNSQPHTHPRRRPSNQRINSKWTTVREKGPQIIMEEKIKKLDLNKGKVREPWQNANNNAANGTSQKSFADVVNTFIFLKTLVTSYNHESRESEPERDLTITNAIDNTIVSVDDQRAILGSQEAFQSHPTGLEILKEFLNDNYRRIIFFTVNKSSTFFYYWSSLISVGILYNMFAMVIFIFDDVQQGYFTLWMGLNIFFDVCFALDCVVGSRITFVSDGNEVRQTGRTFKNYRQSTRFKWDLLSLAPVDLILIIYSHVSLIRVIRMAKAYRLYEFVVLTEKRTDFPHFMKILFLTTSCAVLFHWNACVYFLFSLFEGLSEDDANAFGFSYYKVFDPRFPTCEPLVDEKCWYPENTDVLDLRDERHKYMYDMYAFWEEKYTLLSMGNFSREYSMTIYWSSLTITKCGQQPWPSTSPQNSLEIFDTLIGVLVFATIIGSVGNVVTQMSQNVNDFREMMDGIKFYMKYREVQAAIQDRVLACFLYLNAQNQLYDEQEILSVLPPRFQANIAWNLHSVTLKGVALFDKCDSRFLQEVVLLVKQQVYSPNDYLCRKNEKAKEMFIVKKGTLSVIDDDTGIELDQLKEGSTFGELSIVHVKGNLLGDRRSVSLRSLGFSDVYVLHQDDVSKLLQEYPEDRALLLNNARKMLHARGLMETSELGEMIHQSDKFEDDGMLEFLSVDEHLSRIETIVVNIDNELGQMITSFSNTSGYFKKRITALENAYNSNKKQIVSDLYSGVLRTGYDKMAILEHKELAL